MSVRQHANYVVSTTPNLALHKRTYGSSYDHNKKIIIFFVNLNDNLSDRRLLRHKRAEHIEAVKKIISINSAAKQRDVLKALFEKLFSVSDVFALLFISHF